MKSTTRIPRASAERKLGKAAVRLLECWWVYRDVAKLSTVAPIATVAKDAKLSQATAKRAATRLRRAGLITQARVYVQKDQKIAIRRVYGTKSSPFRADPDVYWYVPDPVAEYLAMAPAIPSHGGDRRSRAARDVARKRALARAQVAPLEPVQVVKRPRILSIEESRARIEADLFLPDQVSHTSTELDQIKQPLFFDRSSLRSSLSKNNRFAGSASGGQPSPGSGFCGFEAPSAIRNLARLGCVEPVGPLQEVVGPSGGIHIQVSGNWLECVRKSVKREFTTKIAREHLPMPPINQYLVPTAPRIRAGSSDASKVRRVALAYAGAISSHLQRPNWLFRRGDVSKSKHFDELVAAANEFEKFGIAPAAWMHWSIKYWEATREERSYRIQAYRYAPLSWTTSPGRIRERAELFFDNGGNSILGGSIVEPERCRKFAVAWQEATRRIVNGDDLVEVLSRYFPNGYTATTNELLLACKTTAQELSDAAASGQYVWGYAYDGVVRERKAAA